MCPERPKTTYYWPFTENAWWPASLLFSPHCILSIQWCIVPHSKIIYCKGVCRWNRVCPICFIALPNRWEDYRSFSDAWRQPSAPVSPGFPALMWSWKRLSGSKQALIPLNEGGKRAGLYFNAMTQVFSLFLTGSSGVLSGPEHSSSLDLQKLWVRVTDSVFPC